MTEANRGVPDPRAVAGGSDAPPLIGVTAQLEPARWGQWIREAALLPVPYVRAVERAGGVPVLLPPTGSLRGLDPLLERLDGIVLAGGGDLDPELYGAERHPETGPPQPRRDRFELALVRAAIAADVPFLAICRGMQALNVARGGTLVQHLPEVVGHDGHAPSPGRFAAHPVRIGATSLTGKILGEAADVPTYHHQAVGRLGKGLVAVAWADDQVVEAVELQGHRFAVGVQWHPEEGDDGRLFEALVAEASGR
ncbi:gamma-glutamyl-gamma-aminobutyrate hydrolase family protein [Spirillospora albida]|uniref:gamma-glutamyl-gamma-aminobutyrate hydrolase family protein n=1 Tax=Spirillospora albida TaxID=58123 RepID=UPI00068DA507|nr:gamma-glutamyl-gamma-aminobutyrate hydrolase family protein [Spirillospora albida]